MQECAFSYTTTRRHFHLLQAPAFQAVKAVQPVLLARRAPCLVLASHNLMGRVLLRPWTALLARAARPAPLVRLCLHPRDAESPLLVRQAQGLLDTMLLTHQPLTKHAFALRWQQVLAEAGSSSRRKW